MDSFSERKNSPLTSAVATGPLHNLPACRERHDSRKREPDTALRCCMHIENLHPNTILV